MVAGCAFGLRTDYSGSYDIKEVSKIPNKLSVAVQDQRPYVLKESHSDTFTGLSRSIYGIPYSMHTKSGRPFAVDFSEMIKSSLEKKGSTVNLIRTSPHDSEQDILAKFKANEQVGLLLSVYNWKTDTYVTSAFHYDVALRVLSPRRKLSQALEI
jgi:hypothetical protein